MSRSLPRAPRLQAPVGLMVVAGLVVAVTAGSCDRHAQPRTTAPTRTVATPATSTVAPGTTAPAPPAGAGAARAATYLVNTASAAAATRAAEAAVRAAGGAVTAAYPMVGVLVATSRAPRFESALRAAPGIESVGRTSSAGVSADKGVQPVTPPASAPGGQDPLEPREYGLRLVHAQAAQHVDPGSPHVVVGVLDDGVDDTAPDLAGQVVPALSTDCTSGAPHSGATGYRPSGAALHGTHVAGIIAAARNGVGVVGVAPGVRLASVKVATGDFIWAQAAVCGLVWAGEHRFRVTNNSYYIDPWLLWCDSDRDQAAVSSAVRKAVAWSQHQGVLDVAALGNDEVDLAHVTVDRSSPDDATPALRQIGPDCRELPAEAPGVVGVGAVDSSAVHWEFSNYGSGHVDLVAPGVAVVSTVPRAAVSTGYAALTGTSMAAPFVAGVAALVASAHPGLTVGQLRSRLLATARRLPCPDAQCRAAGGPAAYNGAGLVDALAAVR